MNVSEWDISALKTRLEATRNTLMHHLKSLENNNKLLAENNTMRKIEDLQRQYDELIKNPSEDTQQLAQIVKTLLDGEREKVFGPSIMSKKEPEKKKGFFNW